METMTRGTVLVVHPRSFCIVIIWFNIAGANGDESVRERRENMERDMTRAEISRAT